MPAAASLEKRFSASGASFGVPTITSGSYSGAFGVPHWQGAADHVIVGDADDDDVHIIAGARNFGNPLISHHRLREWIPAPLHTADDVTEAEKKTLSYPWIPWSLFIPLLLSSILALILAVLVSLSFGRGFSSTKLQAWLFAVATTLLMEHVIFQPTAILIQVRH